MASVNGRPPEVADGLEYIADGDTKADWLDTLDAIKEAIEIGWFDGYLHEIAQTCKARHAARRLVVANNPAADPANDPASVGIYYDPGEEVYWQIRESKQNPGKLYAKKGIVDVMPTIDAKGGVLAPGKIRFVYEPKAQYRITRRQDWKITIEQAKAAGVQFGICLRCGRGLLATSPHIEDMIGPQCYKMLKKEQQRAS